MNEYERIAVLLMFMVDFLLLLGTNRLWGGPPQGGRCAVAAAVGAVHMGLSLLPGLAFLGGWLWRVVFLALMALTAFGLQRSALARGLVFGLLQLAVTAIATGEGFWPLILGALVIFCLCMAARADTAQRYVAVSICHGGKTASMTALVDSGNLLRDPISGRQVLVVGREAAQQLLPLTDEQIADPVGTMEKERLPGLRLIPYHAVGKSDGLLLGLKADEVRIGGEITGHIVAFAPNSIGNGRNFEALTGGLIG